MYIDICCYPKNKSLLCTFCTNACTLYILHIPEVNVKFSHLRPLYGLKHFTCSKMVLSYLAVDTATWQHRVTEKISSEQPGLGDISSIYEKICTELFSRMAINSIASREAENPQCGLDLSIPSSVFTTEYTTSIGGHNR
jgi:hypothetical protein